MLPELEILKRILLAAGMGALLGLEREVRAKSAGLRTNILIAVGSALFTIVSLELGGGSTTDQTRIAAQIVTGMGFLGAGAIIRTRGNVHGLTTAATVWVNAALGMAAGGGDYRLAGIGFGVTMAVLLILPPIEREFDRRFVRRTGRDRPTGV